MSEKAEFVLIERKKGRKNQFMAKKTSSRYYLNYGRTIPVGNQQAFRPADLKVGMIIEGNFKQGVIISSFFFIFKILKARIIAEEPELTIIPYFFENMLAILFSNLFLPFFQIIKKQIFYPDLFLCSC